MQDQFQIENGILKKYTGTGAEVVVPDGVTTIAEWAFFGCKTAVSVELPDSVITIGKLSFSECPNLTEVRMPKRLMIIGEKAFQGCEKLSSVSIPDSVSNIGAYAFDRCKSLTSVTIPSGVRAIGWNTFSNCSALSSATIRKGVLLIGRWAFEHCTSLTSIDIPDGVEGIADMAFNGCTCLSSVTIPDSVTAIGNFAFSNCVSLSSVVIPNSVQRMAPGTFSECRITIVCGEGSYAHSFCDEQNLTYIFDYQYEAFHGLLPQDIERLASPFLADEEDPYIFISYSHKDRDTVLNSIKPLYESGWKIWYDEGLTIGDRYDETLDIHIRNCAAFLLYVTKNSLDSPYIRNNEIPWALDAGRPIIKCIVDDGTDYEIDDRAVQASVSPSEIETALEKVNGLTKGEKRVAKGISVAVSPAERGEADGDGFAYCLYEEKDSAAAKAIIVEAANGGCRMYNAAENGEYGDKLINSACLVVFLSKAFLADKHLRNILIDEFRAGKDIAVCQMEVLEDSDLLEELLDLHLMQWLNYAFGIDPDMNTKLARHLQKRGCRNSAILPGFEYEKTDEGIVITKYNGMNPSPWIESEYSGMPVIGIAENAFRKCVRLKTLRIPDSVKKIGKGAFEGCSELTDVTIPDSVTEIGESAFKGCAALTSVVIPDRVAVIEKWTFEDCSSLETAYVPDSVTEIRTRAFSGCKKLPSLVIPESIERIDDYVFAGCDSFRSVTVPNHIKKIGMMSFNSCKNLESVEIQDGVKEIELGAFCFCRALVSVSIPQSVNEIGPRAFEGCTALEAIEIPDSVKNIGFDAFKNCSYLMVISRPGSAAWKYCREQDIMVSSSAEGIRPAAADNADSRAETGGKALSEETGGEPLRDDAKPVKAAISGEKSGEAPEDVPEPEQSETQRPGLFERLFGRRGK